VLTRKVKQIHKMERIVVTRSVILDPTVLKFFELQSLGNGFYFRHERKSSHSGGLLEGGSLKMDTVGC
jgi:hypothetical protein